MLLSITPFIPWKKTCLKRSALHPATWVGICACLQFFFDKTLVNPFHCFPGTESGQPTCSSLSPFSASQNTLGAKEKQKGASLLYWPEADLVDLWMKPKWMFYIWEVPASCE